MAGFQTVMSRTMLNCCAATSSPNQASRYRPPRRTRTQEIAIDHYAPPGRCGLSDLSDGTATVKRAFRNAPVALRRELAGPFSCGRPRPHQRARCWRRECCLAALLHSTGPGQDRETVLRQGARRVQTRPRTQPLSENTLGLAKALARLYSGGRRAETQVTRPPPFPSGCSSST